MGNPVADLMFVGEGPGRDEDLQGEPFVGRSGKLLDLLIRQEIGIERDQCYIANVVKCLRDDALVQLGDGSWERIGRLVRHRYSGTVKTVDAAGRIVRRRVIGWHASPLAGRRVFRLSYKAAERAGSARAGIQATGDHEVLTEDGWMPIERVSPGARIATGQGLSPVAQDVIVGSLLGDGRVSMKDGHVQMTHSQRQRGYALFKASLLGELEAIVNTGAQVNAAVGSESHHTVVHLHTLASRAVRTLASDFYASGRQRVPSWARMIAASVPNSVRYKLPPDVAAELKFTPAHFADRFPLTQYDEAVVEELDFAGTDSTFYCIDVEETHSFVTAGGVVHNCRPPGNRDPLPAEIEACHPYLEGQIELVAPKVVVTLGNFATKALLDTAEGIRKVRGRVYPFHGVHLVPTYHPAAALRGGGEVVAEMRADFVRAKRLLGDAR